MGICNKRYSVVSICITQLITTIERQIFDFLGFMWVPILVNLLNIIFIIFGFFGVFQYRSKYIILHVVWNVLWIMWNTFLTCFYLNIGILDKNSDILNFGTGSFSWWHVNGPGCKATYDIKEPEMFKLSRPTNVTGCIIEYEVIEVLHSSTQCFLGVGAIIGGICLIQDSSEKVQSPRKQGPLRPLYSIEYSQPDTETHEEGISPKPMTPRRVKRRSVISRDNIKHSSRRSSVRQSRRKSSINRQQENMYANTQPNNFVVQSTNSSSPNVHSFDRISNILNGERNSNWQTECVNTTVSSPNLWNKDFEFPNCTDFLNTISWGNGNSSTRYLNKNCQVNNANDMQWQGQSNPTFQQSSTQSLHGEDIDELYSNRPASARSSYSNYHGVRATPQVPSRTTVVKQSPKQFNLSGGPPGYKDTII